MSTTNPITANFINCLKIHGQDADAGEVASTNTQKDMTMSYTPTLRGGHAVFEAFLRHQVGETTHYDKSLAGDLMDLYNSTKFDFHQTEDAMNRTSPAYYRFACPIKQSRNAPNGTKSICDDTPENRYNVAAFYTAIIKLLVSFGLDTNDINLVKIYKFCYLPGGGIGSHNDYPNNLSLSKHVIRLNIKSGAAHEVEFSLHQLDEADPPNDHGKIQTKTLKGAEKYTINCPAGVSAYAMTHPAQGAYPLCKDGDADDRAENVWIIPQHGVNKLTSGRVVTTVVTFPLKSLELVMKCLDTLRTEPLALDFSDAKYAEHLFGAEGVRLMAVSCMLLCVYVPIIVNYL